MEGNNLISEWAVVAGWLLASTVAGAGLGILIRVALGLPPVPFM